MRLDLLPGAGETLSRVKGLIAKDQHGIAERQRPGVTRVCQGALRKGSIGPWPPGKGKAGEASVTVCWDTEGVIELVACLTGQVSSARGGVRLGRGGLCDGSRELSPQPAIDTFGLDRDVGHHV